MMAFLNDTLIAKPGAGAWIDDMLGNLRSRYARWKAYRRTVDELSALSNRELTELEILRHDIPAIARDAVYGR